MLLKNPQTRKENKRPKKKNSFAGKFDRQK